MQSLLTHKIKAPVLPIRLTMIWKPWAIEKYYIQEEYLKEGRTRRARKIFSGTVLGSISMSTKNMIGRQQRTKVQSTES